MSLNVATRSNYEYRTVRVLYKIWKSRNVLVAKYKINGTATTLHSYSHRKILDVIGMLACCCSAEILLNSTGASIQKY